MGKQGQLPPGECRRLVLQKDTAVVVHLQHTPGREESSASVSASASTMFVRGQAAPPALRAAQETRQEACRAEGKGPWSRSMAVGMERGPRGCPQCCGGAEGGSPYLLQMLQWWVRAGLGAMHFLQMETPVRSSLPCAQVRRGLCTQALHPFPCSPCSSPPL